jgi:PAS domain S-box-containing protein
MTIEFSRWIAPPVFNGDEEKTWRAGLLNSTIIVAILMIVLGIFGNFIGGRIQTPVYIIEGIMFVLVLLLRFLLFNGKVDLTGILLVFFGIILITADIASLGTIRTPGISAYLLMVIIAGLLFGYKGLMFSTISSSLAVLGLILSENAGMLPDPDYYVNVTQWITYSVLTGLTGALTYLSYKSLHHALERMQKEIFQRDQAEKKLRESEAKFRDLVENIDEIIYTLDENGQVTYISPSIESKSGYSSQEIIGRSMGEFFHHEDIPLLMEQFPKILSGQSGSNEYRLVAKSGESYWIRASSRPLYEADRIVGLRGVLMDISESKRLQAQLLQSHKMESIGTLAGGIAHDFNNLLYMILGNAELALDDIPEENPMHANIEEIKTASLMAAEIVGKLLKFSRNTEQKLKPIDAVTVIKDALDFLRSTLPATIEIRKHLPDTDITIFSDPIQINQVLMNIFTNASQAMEETGGLLEINVENEFLTQDAVRNYPDLITGHYLKIMVSDTGIGIDSGIIDRIFDPYFTTKAVGKGSGMGLAVIHGIIKNHGGVITVESQIGKGTVFTILLPVVTEKPMMDTITSEEIPHGNETILFIDDEELILNMTKKMLERLGYTIETKINPVAALELFQSNPDHFDLVITDMTMPQMTGIKLSVKLLAVRPDIPIIVCTGHSHLIDEEKVKALGIADYVIKPVTRKNLAKTIRKVLDKRIVSNGVSEVS